jgi:aspartate aminotransferase
MVDLSDRISLLRVSPIRRVTALLGAARRRSDIISFGGGAPSLPPPKEVLEEMCSRLQHEPLGSSTYTGTRGLPELRRLIAEDVKRYGRIDYSGEKEIIVTNGGTEAIFTVFMSVLNKNDEVIILDPTYLGYDEAIGLSGGRVKPLLVNVEEGYQPDLESH